MKFLRNLAIATVIIGCMCYLGYRVYESKLGAASLRQETLEMATPQVAIIHPKPAAPNETITLPGTMRGWYEATIYARVSGYVKKWHKDYGAEVKKGDLLAEIATPRLDAKYRMAQAEVEAERAQYDLAVVTARRYVNLGPSHSVSKQSITVKQAEAKTQKALLNKALRNLENIKAKLRFKKIVAPYDGVVIERNVTVGDFVNEQGSLSLKTEKEANLFTVADAHKIRLFVNVPESFGAFLQPGLTADVTVPQLPDRHFTAQFLTVAKGFDEDTRTAVSEFVIDNEDGVLWPGSYAKVRLTAPIGQSALIIPASAMVFQEQGAAVAVVTEDNLVRFKPISVSELLGATFKVTDGLSKTDRIVNNPSAALLEGDKVQIVTPAPGYIQQPEEEIASDKQPAIKPPVSR